MVDTKINNKPLKIAVGTDNFKKMVTEYDVFVDKTLFIKEIIDSSEEAILITRPRRWGKTLNLDMLKTFFEPESEECKNAQNYAFYKPWAWSWENNPFYSWETEGSIGRIDKYISCNKDIFRKLQISSILDSRENSILDTYQGKNPVIFISLKDITGSSLEEIENKLKGAIKSLYKEHRYLESSSKLAIDEREDFQKHISQNYANVIIEESIKFLSSLLHKHHGQRVYVLIDEYDKPINSLLEDYLGQEKNPEKELFIKDVTKLISHTVCSSVSKTNPSLEKLVMTGIFDTTQKESGSGCNNIRVFGITDSRFSKSFGFSENEVYSLVSQFKFQNQQKVLENIKDWYDGYTVPISVHNYTHIYTPWAVMNYLNDASYSKGEDLVPTNYWTKSGASTILQRLLAKEKCLHSKLGDHLFNISTNGQYTLNFDVKVSLFDYDWFNDFDNSKFFSYLLLNSGYLSLDKSTDLRGVQSLVVLRIPNAELWSEITKVISDTNNQSCQKIVYDLQKHTQLGMIKAIKVGDTCEVVDKLYRLDKCEDYSMNFNFFHLTAIFGNKSIYQALLDFAKCNKHQSAQDKVMGLDAMSYAFMVDNYSIGELINSPSLESTTLPKFICYLISPFSDSLSGEFIDILFEKWLPVSALLKFGYKVTIKTLAGVGLTTLDKNVEESCNSSRNESIDISNPTAFTSLKQYVKYQSLHSNSSYVNSSYVAINKQCDNTEKTLNEIHINIFQNTFFSEEYIKFILCERTECPAQQSPIDRASSVDGINDLSTCMCYSEYSS